ncbi:MAG TPA: SDR family oxidoreductase [Candidatus Eubacterium faecavium]|nr:SDR family oxidoreductase [Candidatus Eubacterium faecavium]
MRKVLITGGATGIGRECARLFAQKGDDVFITYHETQPDIDCASPVKCDLRKESDIKKLFAEFKTLDVLVNNAGVSLIKMINDTTFSDYDELMAVNSRAVYFCAKEAARLMLKTHSGAIINIASMWGETGASCETLYSMSKAGVIGFTKALAKELAPSGITVNCVSPGIIDTRMNAQFQAHELIEDVPLGRLGSPYDVARTVYFLAGSAYITGQDISVSGGIVI